MVFRDTDIGIACGMTVSAKNLLRHQPPNLTNVSVCYAQESVLGHLICEGVQLECRLPPWKVFSPERGFKKY